MASAAGAIIAPDADFGFAVAARLPWRRWLGWGLSAALLIALATILRHEGASRLRASLPESPVFWTAFAIYYLVLPASEWVIYRRIWRLPAGGFLALLRKFVSNEVLLGYSGELSFYLYARREAGLSTSPFKAIKDVSILSAVAGNLATLGMIALASPVWRGWAGAALPSGGGLSLALLVALPVLLLALRRQIFSLPGKQLRFIMAIHAGRIAATTLLMGVMWTSALPQAPLSLWIGLAALQLVVTRLPMVPNKDIVFAGLAMLVVGNQSQIGALMAFVASLLVATHFVVGLGLLARDALAPRERA